MLVGVIDSGIGGLEIVNRLSETNQYILNEVGSLISHTEKVILPVNVYSLPTSLN